MARADLHFVCGCKYKPEMIGADPAPADEMPDISAAIRNRLIPVRMRRIGYCGLSIFYEYEIKYIL